MKKGFVILLLALAVIVFVSPGLIGRLAEESMDENLDWAATESPELTITSQGFDRGWFSSEGQHRVELKKGNVKAVRTDVLVDKAAEALYPKWRDNLEEWEKTGSDFAYHYLGSAIWFTRMGHAFGAAMLELVE